MASEVQEFFSEWKTKKPKEKLYMVLGGLFLVFAVVGVFLPIVPQVPFAIISGYFLSKGSPRLHKKLRANKYLGRPVRDWEDHRVIRPKLKIFSSLCMVAGAGIGHWKLLLGWAIALDVIFLLAIIFVLSRKSKPA